MTIRYLERRYCYNGHNSISKAETTVAPKLNQSAEGGVLFCLPAAGKVLFCTSKKEH